MKPILYSYFRSSASYRVRIALHLKKIDFEYKAVHLIKDGGQQNALNFTSINPMGQVPLFVDGDVLVGQSVAIIDYIDKKWPTPRLFPDKIDQRAYVLEICELINSGIQPLHNLVVHGKLEEIFKAQQKDKDLWNHFFIQKGLQAIEKRISKTAGQYSFGNEVTAADCFIMPQFVSAQRFGVDPSQFSTIKKVCENLAKIDAFKKAHPSCQPDTPIEN
jgi:maleylacetoacetate isomerase